MLILYLGKSSKLIDFLKDEGNDVMHHDEKEHPVYGASYDCIISYGYGYKISKEMVQAVKGRAINLHISYLPWNRGANPNYWSWKENTPKGVTIHYVDDGIDTGDIIIQKFVQFPTEPGYTLRDAYQLLSERIEDMFIHNWHGIFYLTRRKQIEGGSVHTTKDKMDLVDGWDTKVLEIEGSKYQR
jgi:methionyl-tRNA formyltransferase